MPKPFDATLKNLIRRHPLDWLARVGERPVEPVEVLSADLSAVTAAADTLIRVGGRVIHIDLEAGPDADLGVRMLAYNVLARKQYGLPVRSIAVLLRAGTQPAAADGRVEYEDLSFRYGIIRVWETPADEWLRAGLGLAPLAVLGRPPEGRTRAEALTEQVQRIADRAETESSVDAAELVMSAYLLAGMHTDRSILRAIFERALAMKDNAAYQLIMEEGAVEHARRLLIRLGTARFREPTPAQAARINRIEDIDRLDRLAVRLLEVDSWAALLRGR